MQPALAVRSPCRLHAFGEKPGVLEPLESQINPLFPIGPDKDDGRKGFDAELLSQDLGCSAGLAHIRAKRDKIPGCRGDAMVGKYLALHVLARLAPVGRKIDHHRTPSLARNFKQLVRISLPGD